MLKITIETARSRIERAREQVVTELAATEQLHFAHGLAERLVTLHATLGILDGLPVDAPPAPVPAPAPTPEPEPVKPTARRKR